MLVTQEPVICPHCSSSKVSKNGRKANGKQNYLCRVCAKQFQSSYRYRAADPNVRRTAVSMLCRNGGIRDIAVVLSIARQTVLNILKQFAHQRITPCQTHYHSIEIDELWSYVRRKKSGKRWLIYAYSAEHDEILGYVCGNRSAATVKRLWEQLSSCTFGEVCTDAWEAFSNVLPAELHRVGKDRTRHIEGINTCLRARNRRLVRRTTCFSKSICNHDAALTLSITYRNKHHTI